MCSRCASEFVIAVVSFGEFWVCHKNSHAFVFRTDPCSTWRPYYQVCWMNSLAIRGAVLPEVVVKHTDTFET